MHVDNPVKTATVTEIHIRYRDANNNKEGTTLTFDGAITAQQITQLVSDLDDGLYFIPTQVNLPHLGERLTNFPNEADHAWHELDTDEILVVTRQVHQDDVRNLTEFLTAVTAAAKTGWDDATAAADLRIPVDAS